MGRTVGIMPNPYTPVTARRLKEKLGIAIADHIEKSGVTAAEVSRRYRSVRAGDLQRIRAGDAELYGLSRLIAIAEAMGLELQVSVS